MARKSFERKNYWGAFVLDWFKYLQDNDLTSSDYKILFFLCQEMNADDNAVHLKQKNISGILKMDKGNVSKCIKKLIERQFIVKIDTGFMINPHLFYVGKRHQRDREQIREKFDTILEGSKRERRFNLNEEEFYLEEYPNRLVESKENDTLDDLSLF
jgi:predicted transcriptional regulator